MELSKQLEQALTRIAQLNKELGRDPATDPVVLAHTDPVLVAASQLENKVRDRLREVERKALKAAKDKQHAEGTLRGDAGEFADIYERQIAESDEMLRRCGIHRAALKEKLEKIASDPKSLFLPLGTVVKFTGDMGYETSDQFPAMRGAYPIDGTPGVVIRLNSDSEWPIAVAFRRKFKDANGDTWTPSEDRLITHHFDLSSLEVVGPGFLPNGDEMEEFGYVATHRVEEDSLNERGTEMIIEADGFFWRFIEYGDPKVLEAGTAHKHLNDFSWVLDPINPSTGPRI
jgi:hypothetical protein